MNRRRKMFNYEINLRRKRHVGRKFKEDKLVATKD
jgi:hypothetical protein